MFENSGNQVEFWYFLHLRQMFSLSKLNVESLSFVTIATVATASLNLSKVGGDGDQSPRFPRPEL